MYIYKYIFIVNKGVKNIDISLIEFSDVLSGSDVW